MKPYRHDDRETCYPTSFGARNEPKITADNVHALCGAELQARVSAAGIISLGSLSQQSYSYQVPEYYGMQPITVRCKDFRATGRFRGAALQHVWRTQSLDRACSSVGMCRTTCHGTTPEFSL
jgi:hypothetical protein